MFDWFENFIKEIIWKSLQDAFGSLTTMAEDALKAYLDKLEPDKVLETSPLIKVLAVDNLNKTITFLIRGNVLHF